MNSSTATAQESNSEGEARLLAYYDALYEKHGISTASLGWSSEGQRIRFSQVLHCLPTETCSLLDIGCGFGQLELYARRCLPNIRYAGWDINEKLLAHCTSHAGAAFEKRNILNEPPENDAYDAVVMIGALNTHFGDNEGIMRAMIAAMYAACRKLCVISATSRYADEAVKNPAMWFYDPVELFCFSRSLTRFVDLRHGYLPHDVTLVLYKHGIEHELCQA